MPPSDASENLAHTLESARQLIRENYDAAEDVCVTKLLEESDFDEATLHEIGHTAKQLVEKIRNDKSAFGLVDDMLAEFGLDNQEGIAMMCLAEALLRIPDSQTANQLIEEKLGSIDWDDHIHDAPSPVLRLSSRALKLSSNLVGKTQKAGLKKLISGGGRPVIREAMRQSMKVLGKHFVLGQTIGSALNNASDLDWKGYLYSFDMLGEGARTSKDAVNYWNKYVKAIDYIALEKNGLDTLAGPGMSIKLSALHPRYEIAQKHRVMGELYPKLKDLVLRAKEKDINVTIDAEEADRLDIMLDIFEKLYLEPELKDWEGLGLAVQAYQKRALHVIDWLGALARTGKKRIMVRLVKGAYWDSEIKWAQQDGLNAYPVFTRKESTDVCWLLCAKKLIEQRQLFYPQFATHNAWSVAAILTLMDQVPPPPGSNDHRNGFEFQRLHGMGDGLYKHIINPRGLGLRCRIYAPVGKYRDLLAYLVRRLLENGANNSFINQIRDPQVSVERLIANPIVKIASYRSKHHPKIPLPREIFAPERVNSAGVHLADPLVHAPLLAEIKEHSKEEWKASPILEGAELSELQSYNALDPADQTKLVGRVHEADSVIAQKAMDIAAKGILDWASTPVEARASAIERFADLMEAHRSTLLAMIIKEAGRCIPDAIDEVREAVDFCRYYAAQARKLTAEPTLLPGPTGERNTHHMHPRGVFLCISPWNFPVAIFVGQAVAALAAGNTVIAKPAEQTPIVAARIVKLMLEAGIPDTAISLLPGNGPELGKIIMSHPALSGVAFTGSVEAARTIAHTLLNRGGPLVPLIAETGGQNAMIVDSSALPEQVTDDVMTSAFRSTGQRCSALRVLFVEEGIAAPLIDMIEGAAMELTIGNPMKLETDMGPVIDFDALGRLKSHEERMKKEAKLLFQNIPGPTCKDGFFIGPRAYELSSLDQLDKEVFGPILHIIRYHRKDLDKVIDHINATGYGLTLGIHSRLKKTADHIISRAKVGNIYVNRSMIGAVVGSQPFGGEGLSGTGPKAGGPNYLPRFMTERTVSNNIAAVGGDASLINLD